MMYQSWWTSIWSLCLNQQSISFTIQTPTSLNTHYSHSHTLPRKLIRKIVQSNSLQRSQKRMWSAWKYLSYSHLSNWAYFILKINKEKKLFMEITIKGVSCSIYQCDVFLFPILHFPPFQSFMSPRYKLFTSRKWWRWDLKYLRWHSP